MEKEIYFAGGCFWGVQEFFSCIAGVLSTEAGYANGGSAAPSYEEVCSGSGHAETVRVVYDPQSVSLPFLLGMFYSVIDPTSADRQGPDRDVYKRQAAGPAAGRCSSNARAPGYPPKTRALRCFAPRCSRGRRRSRRAPNPIRRVCCRWSRLPWKAACPSLKIRPIAFSK